MNRTMIMLSGCFLLVWSSYKWKKPHVIWDAKYTRACSVLLGLYGIILAAFYERNPSIYLVLIDFVFYMLLDICFMVLRLKKAEKGVIKNLQLGFSFLFFMFAVITVFFDLSEIYSCLTALASIMMILSTPFEEVIFKQHNK